MELHQLEPGRRRRINATMTSVLKAIADYTPGPYPGRVTLLWPDESAKVPNDPAAGWSEVAAAVDVRSIPGNHISCVTEHLGSFGATLRECLDKAAAAADVRSCVTMGS